MGIAEVLTVVLVLLKLTDIITWSWWLVLLPAIVSFSLYIIIIVMKLIMVLVAVLVLKKRDATR
ncbi:transmembrane Fragile-X-F protein [Lysinibacillus fusiformis]|uniref:transmembrane Fragile-X-F protein n=1 Tax=Lysinibacillus fusiformis TaxID=28031 RepID=UPI001E625081|nr:transmembrane Fragile-X-F protein [Lysinibacillus fusiformis]MCE4042892.1 transmembrane Fragile-X-F protein [Lysinibacillus fusiformis]